MVVVVVAVVVGDGSRIRYCLLYAASSYLV